MRLALLALLCLVPCAVAVGAEPTPPAALHAVRFVDANEGWAAGDGGLVLRTIDGGATWERQPTGCLASLRGLWMVDPYTGFAVGRTELPGGGSAGVVLRTTDGGATWAEANLTALPGLMCVQFVDERTGFAAGDCTDAFPTGVYRTADGGRTWQALAGPRVNRYHAVSCARADAGLFASDRGVMILRGDTLTPLPTIPGAAPGARAVACAGDRALVAGSVGGTVQRLAGAGADWQAVAATPAVAEVRALAVSGDAAFAVGRCGKVMFHSGDFGATWSPKPVPTTVPLNAVCAVDAKTAWAVGDLGTVLRTTDGGATWRAARAAGERAAVLFVHARADSVPLALAGKLARGDDYHVVAATTTACDPIRLGAAVREVAGVAAEVADPAAWPLWRSEATPGRTAETLKAMRDERAVEKLVYCLRVWRPEVVVTDAVTAASPTPDCLAVLHLREAFARAADPTAFPDQITVLGLEPHAVKKLLCLDPAGPVSVDLAAFAPVAGASWRHHAEAASDLLPGRPAPAPTARLRVVAHRVSDADAAGDIMAGVTLAVGGTARRHADDGELNPAWVAGRQAVHNNRRAVDALCAQPADRAHVRRITDALGQLPGPAASRAGMAAAATYARRGEWAAARELVTFVADTHPLQTEAADAVRWLVRFQASGEFTRRAELGHFPVFRPDVWDEIPAPAVRPAGVAALAPGAKFRLRDPETARAYHQSAVDLPARLAAFGGAYTRDPAPHLCANAARRRLGLAADGSRALRVLLAANAATPSTDPRKRRLVEELRAGSPDAGEPDPTAPRLPCRHTASKPFLDGKLDDDCWGDSTPATLAHWSSTAAATTHPTTVRAVTDGEFLYVALTCAAPHGTKPADTPGVSGQDRVELLLDLDRDYSTYYRVRVDGRGKTDADCSGDPTWTARHFAAAARTPDGGWSAELAIPLAALTGTKPWGEVWAFDAVRVVPGAGAGGWAGPATGDADPLTLGHLRFPTKADAGAK